MTPLMNGDVLLTRDELCERWHCSKSALIAMEKEGTLTRVGSEYGAPPTILYRLSDILRIENGDNASALTSWERQRLEAEVARLKEKNQKLVNALQELSARASMASAEAFREVYG